MLCNAKAYDAIAHTDVLPPSKVHGGRPSHPGLLVWHLFALDEKSSNIAARTGNVHAGNGSDTARNVILLAMMARKIQCPNCQTQVPFDESWAGQIVECSDCGTRIRTIATPPSPPVSTPPANFSARRSLLSLLRFRGERNGTHRSRTDDHSDQETPAIGFRRFVTLRIAGISWILTLVAATATAIGIATWGVALATMIPALTVDSFPDDAKSTTILVCNNGPIAASGVAVTVTAPQQTEIKYPLEESAAIQSTVLLNGSVRLRWQLGRLDDGDSRRLRLSFAENLPETLDMSYECRSSLPASTLWTIAGLAASVPLLVLAVLFIRMALETAVVLHHIERHLLAMSQHEQD